MLHCGCKCIVSGILITLLAGACVRNIPSGFEVMMRCAFCACWLTLQMTVIEAHSLVSNPSVQASLVNYTKSL